MALPVEVKLRIFEELVDTSPWEEVWRARLVSTYFEHELTKLIIKSPRFEVESLRFERVFQWHEQARQEARMWNTLPIRLKHLYLYRKVQIHSRSPSRFSSLVQDILDVPNERTSAETDTLINKLIDAWMCSKFRPMRPFVDPTDDRSQMEWVINDPQGGFVELEPLQETLNLALATSAIKRNDCAELRTLLSKGANLAQESMRFGIMPLAEAAYSGSKEGNKQALKVWIDHLKKSARSISKYLDLRETAALASMETMEFIDDEYGDELDRSRLRGEMFRAAIYSKDLAKMQRILDRGGVNLNRLEGHTGVSPLWALLDIPQSDNANEISRQRENVTQAVELLLRNGADPNGYPSPSQYHLSTNHVASEGQEAQSTFALVVVFHQYHISSLIKTH
ncbi:hypothetical protein ACN42_g2199 [Penicillium freii]|uniref:Uncharacterized protein n=1 Tax=Penicillium freii TaxID=48697 RepID=A0A117NR48_PENFR|nr:hypothetical protein ACN42_g2199 [Penicillium freii]